MNNNARQDGRLSAILLLVFPAVVVLANLGSVAWVLGGVVLVVGVGILVLLAGLVALVPAAIWLDGIARDLDPPCEEDEHTTVKLGTATSATRPPTHAATQLRSLLGPPLSLAWQTLVTLIQRDFISSWHDNLTNGHSSSLPSLIEAELQQIALTLATSFQKIDITSLVMRKALPELTAHLRAIRLQEALLRGNDPSYDGEVDIDDESEIFTVGRYSQFRTLHPAVGALSSPDTRPTEVAHLRSVAERLLAKCMSEEQASCAAVRIVMREILASTVLLPLVDRLSDPDFWTDLVDRQATAILEETQTQQEELSSGGTDARPRKITFDAYLAQIRNTASLSEAQRVRGKLVQRLKSAGPTSSDTHRLRQAITTIDERIAQLHTEPTQPPTTTLKHLLNDAVSLSYLTEFLQRRRRDKLIAFYIAVETWKEPLEMPAAPTLTTLAGEDAVRFAGMLDEIKGVTLPAKSVADLREFVSEHGANVTERQARMAILHLQDAVYDDLIEEDWAAFTHSRYFALVEKSIAAGSAQEERAVQEPFATPSASTLPPIQRQPTVTTPPDPHPHADLFGTSPSDEIATSRHANSWHMQQLTGGKSGTLSHAHLSGRSPLFSDPLFDEEDDEDTQPLAFSTEGTRSSTKDQGYITQETREALEDGWGGAGTRGDADIASTARHPPTATTRSSSTSSLPSSGPTQRPRPASGLSLPPVLTSPLTTFDSESWGTTVGSPIPAQAPTFHRTPSSKDISAATTAMTSPIHSPPPAFSRASSAGLATLGLRAALQASETPKRSRSPSPATPQTTTSSPPVDLSGSTLHRLRKKQSSLTSQLEILSKLAAQTELMGVVKKEHELVRKSISTVQRDLHDVTTQREAAEEYDLVPGRVRVDITSANPARDAEGKEYVSFTVRLTLLALHEGKPSVSWTINRRYSEFDALHSAIDLRSLDTLFPRKRLVSLHTSETFIESRREALEKYLCALVNLEDACRSPVVRRFFTPGAPVLTSEGSVSNPTSTPPHIVLDLFRNVDDFIFGTGPTSKPLIYILMERFSKRNVGVTPKPTSTTSPLLDILIELLDLKEDQWLRSALTVVIQQLLGGTIDRQVRSSLTSLCSRESLTIALSNLVDSLWPLDSAGVRNFRKRQAPEQTPQSTHAKRHRARMKVDLLIPPVASLVGGDKARQGARRLLDALVRNRRLNRHLVYVLMDLVVDEVLRG